MYNSIRNLWKRLGCIITFISFIASIITIYIFFTGNQMFPLSDMKTALPSNTFTNQKNFFSSFIPFFIIFLIIGFIFSFLGYYSRAYNRREGGGGLIAILTIICGVIGGLFSLCLVYVFNEGSVLFYIFIIIFTVVLSVAIFQVMKLLN